MAYSLQACNDMGGQSKGSGRVPIRGESITYCTKWVPEAKTGRQAGGVQRGSECNQTAWLQEDWRPNEGKYCCKYCRGSVMTSWITRTERHMVRILLSMKSQESQTLTPVHCRCGKDLLSVLVLNTTSLIADRWDCWMETPPRGGAPGLWKNTTPWHLYQTTWIYIPKSKSWWRHIRLEMASHYNSVSSVM